MITNSTHAKSFVKFVFKNNLKPQTWLRTVTMHTAICTIEKVFLYILKILLNCRIFPKILYFLNGSNVNFTWMDPNYNLNQI